MGIVSWLKRVDVKLGDEDINLVVGHLAGDSQRVGLERFMDVTRICYVCQARALLSKASAADAETVRRVDVGELLVALEVPTKHEGADLERVRCKALLDKSCGWVTIASNSGQVFLEVAVVNTKKSLGKTERQKSVEKSADTITID